MVERKSAESIVLLQIRTLFGKMQEEGRNLMVLDPQYIVGFVDGEGCFAIPSTEMAHDFRKYDYFLRLK